ncbi:hypothetical protein X736_20340 [Mesorhizobium sp. L2C089B000]|nr:hypothetical protein X736_20340 [Mesorhizobium sp. L2C089B000]
MRSKAGDLAELPNNPGVYVFGKEDLETIATLPSGTIYGSSAMRFTAAQYSTASSSQQHLQARMDAWAGLGISLETLAQCMLFGSPTCIQDAAAVALDEAVTKRCVFLKRTEAQTRSCARSHTKVLLLFFFSSDDRAAGSPFRTPFCR